MSFTFWVFLFGVVLFVAERLYPRNNFPKVKAWYNRALILNIIGLSTVYLYGVYSEAWIEQHRLWDASILGLFGSVIVGLLIVTFFNYWWHRLRHYSSFFWVWFHQNHHSAQRLEVITTFYKHPLEAMVDTLLTIPIVYLVAGLSPKAASIVLAIMGGSNFFIIGISKHRNGLGILFKDQKVIVCIISMDYMLIIIVICLFGIFCLELLRIRISLTDGVVLGQQMN